MLKPPGRSCLHLDPESTHRNRFMTPWLFLLCFYRINNPRLWVVHLMIETHQKRKVEIHLDFNCRVLAGPRQIEFVSSARWSVGSTELLKQPALETRLSLVAVWCWFFLSTCGCRTTSPRFERCRLALCLTFTSSSSNEGVVPIIFMFPDFIIWGAKTVAARFWLEDWRLLFEHNWHAWPGFYEILDRQISECT